MFTLGFLGINAKPNFAPTVYTIDRILEKSRRIVFSPALDVLGVVELNFPRLRRLPVIYRNPRLDIGFGKFSDKINADIA